MSSHEKDDAKYLQHEAEFYEEPEPETEKPSWLKRSLDGVIITSAVVATTATALLMTEKLRPRISAGIIIVTPTPKTKVVPPSAPQIPTPQPIDDAEESADEGGEYE